MEENEFKDFQEKFVYKFSYLGFLKLYKKCDELKNKNKELNKKKYDNVAVLEEMKKDM